MTRGATHKVNVVLAVGGSKRCVEFSAFGMFGVDGRLALLARFFRIETHLSAFLEMTRRAL